MRDFESLNTRPLSILFFLILEFCVQEICLSFNLLNGILYGLDTINNVFEKLKYFITSKTTYTTIEDIQVFGVNMSFISLSEVKIFYIS